MVPVVPIGKRIDRGGVEQDHVSSALMGERDRATPGPEPVPDTRRDARTPAARHRPGTRRCPPRRTLVAAFRSPPSDLAWVEPPGTAEWPPLRLRPVTSVGHAPAAEGLRTRVPRVGAGSSSRPYHDSMLYRGQLLPRPALADSPGEATRRPGPSRPRPAGTPRPIPWSPGGGVRSAPWP